MEKSFVIKKVTKTDIYEELERVGYDKSYINKGIEKFQYCNFKIFSLNLAQANILKQTALTVGADCAVHHDILTANTHNTDCILGGNVSQLRVIIKKLKRQPFSMKTIANELEKVLMQEDKKEPQIVGILNLTKDSFSDGGKYFKYTDAINHLEAMLLDGADVIDIGAESTKPFSKPISSENQLEKIEPILGYIANHNIKTPISVDTRSSEVAQKAIDMGATIINDVSGLDFDRHMIDVISKNRDVKIIIQHSKGTPEDMQVNPRYQSVTDEVYQSLYEKIRLANNKGIENERIITDVGIGFGKTLEQNFELLRGIKDFHSLGCDIMVGLSRKSLLNENSNNNEIKDILTIALNSLMIEKNVKYLRVHNVGYHKKLVNLMKNYRI